jgi:hypothetical protein
MAKHLVNLENVLETTTKHSVKDKVPSESWDQQYIFYALWAMQFGTLIQSHKSSHKQDGRFVQLCIWIQLMCLCL